MDFIDLYLRKKRDYFLYALGRNGEHIPNLEVKISYNMVGYQREEETALVTNDNGCICLGQLEYVEKMRVQTKLKSGIMEREWILEESELEVNYLDSTMYKVG